VLNVFHYTAIGRKIKHNIHKYHELFSPFMDLNAQYTFGRDHYAPTPADAAD